MDGSARTGCSRHRLGGAQWTTSETSAACRVRPRLIKTVLHGYGGVRLDLIGTGLACFMLVDLDRPDARIEERGRTSCGCGRNPHSHSVKTLNVAANMPMQSIPRAANGKPIAD